MLKVRLKTRKQLEQMGYVYNPKSLFAPMSIDVSPNEKRLVDNQNKIIPMAIFKLLGKDVFVDISHAYEKNGVMTARFETTEKEGNYRRNSGYHLPIVIIRDMDESKVRKVQDKEAVQKKALEEKQKREEEFKNKKVTLGGIEIDGNRSIDYYINQKVFKVGCRTIKPRDMKKIIKFAQKHLSA